MQVNCSHDFLLSLTSLQKVQLALIFFGFVLLENQPSIPWKSIYQNLYILHLCHFKPGNKCEAIITSWQKCSENRGRLLFEISKDVTCLWRWANVGHVGLMLSTSSKCASMIMSGQTHAQTLCRYGLNTMSAPTLCECKHFLVIAPVQRSWRDVFEGLFSKLLAKISCHLRQGCNSLHIQRAPCVSPHIDWNHFLNPLPSPFHLTVSLITRVSERTGVIFILMHLLCVCVATFRNTSWYSLKALSKVFWMLLFIIPSVLVLNPRGQCIQCNTLPYLCIHVYQCMCVHACMCVFVSTLA